jgi:NADH:ubiquinone oxidoreductase subunit E
MTSQGVFSSEVQSKITHYLERYETKRSSIIPILQFLQDTYGWVSEQHIDALESQYGLHRVHIKEVLTFYKAFHQEKPRKYHIQFCDNIVCCMMGAGDAMDKIASRIEALEKELGEDCPFEMIGVPCLGVCDGAPAMLVNKDRYLNVTSDKVDEILSKYSRI